MRVIGYARVSTEEQATQGVSLTAQEERIQAYCLARGWECAEMIVDAAESAASLKRPGIEEVIARCQAKQTEGIVVLKLDRLTRSVRDLGYLIEDVFQKNGVAFTSVQDNFDTTTANGRLVLNILGTVAQWERDVIAERTSLALQYKKANQQRYGQVPFGYDLAADGKVLVPNEDEWEVIRQMARWREAGQTLQEIADRLTTAGIAAQNGGRWAPATVRGILMRTEEVVA